MSLSQAPGTINEESPALARVRRRAVDDVRCVSAAMHVMRYPLEPEYIHYLVLTAKRARESLEALSNSLLFHSDPEFANTGYQEDVAEHCS